MTQELDFDSQIDALIEDIRECEKNIEYFDSMIASYQSVKKEEQDVIANYKQSITDLMRADGVKSTRQCVLKAVPPCPIILEEDRIPEEFIKITRSIDKAGINKAIKEGRFIEGVGMSNGGETLVIKG